MKRTVLTLLAIAALSCFFTVPAANAKDKEKDKTVTGVAKCAKCALHQSETCQNVIEVKKGNKTTSYYLVDNDVSKAFHENICKGSKNVRATFKVTGEKGKQIYTPTKIEVIEGK